MFNLGGGEILVIFVVALLVLGPDKLPRFMRTAGKALGDLRRASTDFQRTMNLELAENEVASKTAKPEDQTPPAAREHPQGQPGEAAVTPAQNAPLAPRPVRRLRAARIRKRTLPIARR